jgi:hypothetical protein
MEHSTTLEDLRDYEFSKLQPNDRNVLFLRMTSGMNNLPQWVDEQVVRYEKMKIKLDAQKLLNEITTAVSNPF